MRYVRFMLSICLLILFSACGWTRGAPTPHDAVFAGVMRWPRSGTVIGSRPYPLAAGQLIAYSRTDDPAQHPPPHNLGYALVAQQDDGLWRIAQHQAAVDVEPILDGRLVYRRGQLSVGQGDVAIVYGRMLKPEWEVIEVVFESGQIERDTIEHADDGRFMLIGDAAQAACELRLFNYVGQLEHQLRLDTCD